MNKNIAGYCGYIGLISFVAYRPATDLHAFMFAAPRQTRRLAQAARAMRKAPDNTSNDMLMTRCRITAQI
jgi:hypothetical protein